jgi:ferritin-like metal-binding protein YciE
MHAEMLRSFVQAELGELCDAERVHLAALPHMATVVRDARKQRMIRSRIPQAHLHAEQLHELLANYADSDSRSCGRIRQLVRSYERACLAPAVDADEAVVAHLLRMDDYLIAASTFALRCAEAIAETPCAMKLGEILAAKECAREALTECSTSA